MLDFCRRQRVFVPYYLPFRLGSAAFIRRFYDWDIRRSAWFFRFRLLFKLLLPGWQEPPPSRNELTQKRKLIPCWQPSIPAPSGAR